MSSSSIDLTAEQLRALALGPESRVALTPAQTHKVVAPLRVELVNAIRAEFKEFHRVMLGEVARARERSEKRIAALEADADVAKKRIFELEGQVVAKHVMMLNTHRDGISELTKQVVAVEGIQARHEELLLNTDSHLLEHKHALARHEERLTSHYACIGTLEKQAAATESTLAEHELQLANDDQTLHNHTIALNALNLLVRNMRQ